MPKVDCITLLYLFFLDKTGVGCCAAVLQDNRRGSSGNRYVLRNISHFEICGTINRRSAPVRCSLDRCCRNYVSPPFSIYPWRTRHSPASQLVCRPVLMLCVYMSSLSLCGCERNEQRRSAKMTRRDYRSCYFVPSTLFLYVLGSWRTVCAAVQVSKGSQKKKGTRNWWPDNSRRASLHSVMLKTRSIIKRRPWKPSHSI
jgi:hypothetical protein